MRARAACTLRLGLRAQNSGRRSRRGSPSPHSSVRVGSRSVILEVVGDRARLVRQRVSQNLRPCEHATLQDEPLLPARAGMPENGGHGPMTTRRITIALVLAFGALSQHALLAAQSSTPNILWIIVDDMSANFSSYGETLIETPHVDRLASDGVRFSNAYVTAPVCSPNRSAFITGMYQTSIGAHHHNSGPREAEDPLAGRHSADPGDVSRGRLLHGDHRVAQHRSDDHREDALQLRMGRSHVRRPGLERTSNRVSHSSPKFTSPAANIAAGQSSLSKSSALASRSSWGAEPILPR